MGITYNPIDAAVSAYKKSSDNTEFSDSAVGQVMSHAEAVNKAAQAATTAVVVTGGSQKITQNSTYSTTQAVVTQAEAQGSLILLPLKAVSVVKALSFLLREMHCCMQKTIFI